MKGHDGRHLTAVAGVDHHEGQPNQVMEMHEIRGPRIQHPTEFALDVRTSEIPGGAADILGWQTDPRRRQCPLLDFHAAWAQEVTCQTTGEDADLMPQCP